MKHPNFLITWVFAILFLSVISCSKNEKGNKSFLVNYKGALKNMMRKGDISAKANLLEFSNIDHLYALGAIENLKGEVQIFDGQPFNSFVKNDSLLFDASFDRKATLLVYASVDKWDSLTIPKDIANINDLEKFIAQTAKTKQISH